MPPNRPPPGSRDPARWTMARFLGAMVLALLIVAALWVAYSVLVANQGTHRVTFVRGDAAPPGVAATNLTAADLAALPPGFQRGINGSLQQGSVTVALGNHAFDAARSELRRLAGEQGADPRTLGVGGAIVRWTAT